MEAFNNGDVAVDPAAKKLVGEIDFTFDATAICFGPLLVRSKSLRNLSPLSVHHLMAQDQHWLNCMEALLPWKAPRTCGRYMAHGNESTE